MVSSIVAAAIYHLAGLFSSLLSVCFVLVGVCPLCPVVFLCFFVSSQRTYRSVCLSVLRPVCTLFIYSSSYVSLCYSVLVGGTGC